MQVMAGFAATVVLWLGGRQVLQGTMTLGEFVAFNGYLAMLTWPLMAIGYTANQYQRGTAALARLAEVLDTPIVAALRAIVNRRRLRARTDCAALSNFAISTFAYGSAQPPVLKNIQSGNSGGEHLRYRG